jgi:hypothetical protein
MESLAEFGLKAKKVINALLAKIYFCKHCLKNTLDLCMETFAKKENVFLCNSTREHQQQETK